MYQYVLFECEFWGRIFVQDNKIWLVVPARGAPSLYSDIAFRPTAQLSIRAAVGYNVRDFFIYHLLRVLAGNNRNLYALARSDRI